MAVMGFCVRLVAADLRRTLFKRGIRVPQFLAALSRPDSVACLAIRDDLPPEHAGQPRVVVSCVASQLTSKNGVVRPAFYLVPLPEVVGRFQELPCCQTQVGLELARLRITLSECGEHVVIGCGLHELPRVGKEPRPGAEDRDSAHIVLTFNADMQRRHCQTLERPRKRGLRFARGCFRFLCLLRKSSSEYHGAVQLLQAAVEMNRRLYPQDRYWDWHRLLAMSLNNFGTAHASRSWP